MEEKVKKIVKSIFSKFGLEIRKIKYEHDRFEKLEQNFACKGCSAGEIKTDKIWEEFKKEAAKIKISSEIDKNPFLKTKRVMFELSNICNYSMIHAKCPLVILRQNPTILPSKLVYQPIDVLKKYQFKGEIAFHNYNEPLIDPRLFKFIEYTRKNLPDSKIYICTNGFYLTQTMVDELVEAGVGEFHISVYSELEMKRFSKINFKIPVVLTPTELLEGIIEIYNSKELLLKKPCFSPLDEVIISRDGEVSLCCLDWKRIYTFGSLKEKSFDDILRNPAMHELARRLEKGDRFLEICKRCSQTR